MHISLGRAFGAVFTAAFITVTAGCGDDNKSSTDTDATVPAVSDVSFAGQWARTSPAMATAGAIYITITSEVDDNLIAASVAETVAARVELHETVTAMGSDTTMMGGGEMSMRPVEFIELPAGVGVELKPGGYHIMLFDLVNPLEVGTSIQLTLVFEKAGEISVEVPVLDEAP
ncbi:MAG: copper chaperone PCu(A)C [Ilumatobacteraceae bacterium]